MKKTFAEKTNILAFLGAVALVSATAIFLHSCNKNPEKKTQKNPEEQPPNAKVEKRKTTSNKRAIYFTFDDGPNKGTQNLLKIIHERKIPVTAFIVGKHVYGSKKQKADFEILKNDTLVELANHSFTHANNKYSDFYKNPELVVNDFNQAKDSLKFKNNFARTPGRNIWRTNEISVTDLKSSAISADELQKAGYKVVGWDLEWKPNKEMVLKGTHKEMLKKVDSIFFNDLEKTSRNLVFLTHDQYLEDENSVRELALFIQKLQESKRFEFKKLSDYPKINDILN